MPTPYIPMTDPTPPNPPTPDEPRSPLYHRDRYQALEGAARAVVVAIDRCRFSSSIDRDWLQLVEANDALRAVLEGPPAEAFRDPS